MTQIYRKPITVQCVTVLLMISRSLAAAEALDKPRVADNGTVHVPAFDLPLSPHLSEATRIALEQRRQRIREFAAAVSDCGELSDVNVDRNAGIRECHAEKFYATAWYQNVRDRYSVELQPRKIAGVYTEVFTPTNGIAPENSDRVLINLHGGGFVAGSRTNSHLESIPIAAVGRIKVISVDYRLAPEHVFPAASEDVANVYEALLKEHSPENIGIYGCSAGAALTAQAMAWFQKEKLPLPGAIAMLCGSAYRSEGDIGKLGWWLMGFDIDQALSGQKKPYLDEAVRNNPLATPGLSDELMRRFPPSLLVSSTRDAALSGVIVTHRQLTRLGVETELQLWEGLDHAFIYDPNIPESREVYQILVEFFSRHLG